MQLAIDLIDPDPTNVRRNADADLAGLTESIRALGVLQPIAVIAAADRYTVKLGNRRLLAAKAAGLTEIPVTIMDGTEAELLAAQTAENMVRSDLRPVEMWRAMHRLVEAGTSLPAAALMLGITERTAKQLEVMGGLLPAILDHIEATNDMPSGNHMSVIALRDHKAQAAAWKKHKPKKGEAAYWWEIARALAVASIPRAYALFDDELAKAHGVTWQTDWLAPPEHAEHTTEVAGFMGAQKEMLENQIIPALKAKGVTACMAVGEHGSVKLPKGIYAHTYNLGRDKWEKVKHRDVIGFVIMDDGRVRNAVWSLPAEQPKKAKPAAGQPDAAADADAIATEAADADMLTKDGYELVQRRKRLAASVAVQGDDLGGLLRTLLLLVRDFGNREGMPVEPLDDVGRLLLRGEQASQSDAMTGVIAREMIRHLLVKRDDRVTMATVNRVGAAWNGTATLPMEDLDKVKKPGLLAMAAATGVEARAYKTQKELRKAIERAHVDRGDADPNTFPPLLWDIQPRDPAPYSHHPDNGADEDDDAEHPDESAPQARGIAA